MRKSSAGFRRWVWLLLAIVGVIPSWCLAASKPATAKFSVDGVGFLRNRELSAALTRLLDTELKETLDANAIEDAAVILVSSLGEQGFQKPEILIDMILEDGTKRRLVFDPTFANPLPRPLSAREVRFEVKRGVRFHIDRV